jgi:purine catabolism regulator
MEHRLTIREAFTRPIFQKGYLAAGFQGLDRPIRWVHILELPEVDQWLHGEELILTTGVAFRNNPAKFASYIEQLARKNVSALGVSLGFLYESSIPDEIVELADRLNFPLIVFPMEVRFIDITQDLNSIIVNRNHSRLIELEQTSRKFQRLALQPQAMIQILQLLHSSTGAQVLCMPEKSRPQAYPSLSQAEMKKWSDHILAHMGNRPKFLPQSAGPHAWKHGDHFILVQLVGGTENDFTYLAMIMKNDPQEYDYLFLDSASFAIAHYILIKSYREDGKLKSESEWVDDLLHRRIQREQELKSFLGPSLAALSEAVCRVCVVEWKQDGDQMAETESGSHPVTLRLVFTLRSLLEQHFFHPLITWKNNRIMAVALDRRTDRGAKQELQTLLESLAGNLAEPFRNVSLVIGVGGPCRRLIEAHRSRREAEQALLLREGGEAGPIFFEDLGVYQLLCSMADRDRSALEEFVHRYLGPLIEYDRDKGGALVQTLKVYLDHDGSKQVAAQKLFIVRQSLYYRLEKIAELLGPDFMESENRLALQVALRAFQLLNANSPPSPAPSP